MQAPPSTQTSAAAVQHARPTPQTLFLPLFLSGLPGIIAMAWLLVPLTLAGKSVPVPVWVISVASAVQTSLLLALAAYTGARLAPRVGLDAPLVRALASGAPVGGILGPRLVPAAAGGVLGAVVLWVFARWAPTELAGLRSMQMPLAVRLLYGGIAEEILVRWGLMTWIAWLGWRFVGGGAGPLSSGTAWVAIAISSVLFGVLHLPAVAAMLGPPDGSVVAYVLAGNAAFGLVAGYLYWRHGLEAAVIAHALAHAVHVAVAG